MPRFSRLSLLLVVALGACATASPEDAAMSNAMCEQGKTLLQSGKAAEARDLYASATKRDDDNARAWNGLGVANDMLGKRAEAERAYKEALSVDPDNLAALNNLAHADIVAGEYEKAAALLAPHVNDAAASTALKQNYAQAQAHLPTESEDTSEVYAELGSYPTEGMAQGHVNEAKQIMGRRARKLTFAIVPEVNSLGGIPIFVVHVTGKPPEDLCETFNAEALPCIPHGK